MSIIIKKINSSNEFDDCLAIRKKVFAEEQGVSIDEEIDGLDEKSQHFLLCLDDKSIATARVRYYYDHAKIERVAVLAQYRRQGIGKKLLQYIIAYLAEVKHVKNLEYIKLGSQTHAIKFYQKLGFKIYSEEYIDADIPHNDMFLLI